MFGFGKRSGPASSLSCGRASGPRSVRLQLEALEDRQLLSVSMVFDGFHRDLFYLGTDHQVYEQQFEIGTNKPIAGPTLTQAGQVKAISVIEYHVETSPSAAPRLFVIGLDDQVWEQPFDLNGHSTGGYSLLEPGKVQAVWAADTSIGVPLVFVIGQDRQVYEQRFTADGGLAVAYQRTQPGAVQNIQVTEAFDGARLFALGLDNQVYRESFDQNGVLTAGYSLVALGKVQSFQVDLVGLMGIPTVYGLGLDNQVYAVSSASPGPWSLVGFGKVQSFQVSEFAHPIDSVIPAVFAMGLDGQAYVQSSSGPYTLATPGGVKAVLGGSRFPANTLFVIGLDDRIYEQSYDGFGHPLSGYVPTGSGPVADR